MITQEVEICNFTRHIHTAETAADTKKFAELIANDRPWAFDVETNAYPIHHSEFKVRLVQFGDCYDAYNFPVEHKGLGSAVIRKLLASLDVLVAHVAKYDILSLAAGGFIKDPEDLATRYVDTKILTHLIDPKGKKDGGIGHKLTELCKHYLDDEASIESDKLLNKRFKELGYKTKEEGYRRIGLFDPIYLEYAGLDVINTALIYDTVGALVREQQA